MRTKSFIRQLVFVLILWLATGGGLTVRSQVIPNNTYIVNNRLPQPYLQPNNNTNPNNTNLNNTRAVFDQLNPSTTAPFTRPTQQPQPTTTQQNHTTTNPPQNDPHQNEPPKSGGIVLVNRTCDVFDRLFDSLNDRVTQPLRNLVGRSRLGSGIGRRRYISERDSFVGRQLRGMEIFGGQIEPPTTSNSSSFTAIESFKYNRNSFTGSALENDNSMSLTLNSLTDNLPPIQLTTTSAPNIQPNARHTFYINEPSYPVNAEIAAFLGAVANGAKQLSDYDVDAGNLVEYAKEYGIDPNLIFFDPANSKVTILNPISSGYSHSENLEEAQLTYNYLAEYKIPYNVGGGGAYGLGRQKAADNMTIVPTNRIIFDYSYLHNVKLPKGSLQINRMTVGFEKTLLKGRASFEMRIPLAVTMDNRLDLFGNTEVDQFRLGDMTIVTKYILSERRNMMWTTGIGFSVPLAEDMSIVNPSTGQDFISWKNRTFHVMPYLGLSVVPDDRLFFNAVMQGDAAVIGDTTYIADFTNPTESGKMLNIGKTYDRTYLYASLAIGYWVRRQSVFDNQVNNGQYQYNGQAPNIGYAPNSPYPNYPNPNLAQGYIMPEAVPAIPYTPNRFQWAMNFTAELHWTQSIRKSRGIYYQQGNYKFNIGNDSSSYHAVDMTFGTRLLFNKKTSLGVGYTVPLTGDHRQFDGELRATYNRYF